METTKQKKINNIIMIVVIAVIAVAAVLTVGYIKGWFDGSSNAEINNMFGYIEKEAGIVKIERNGVSFEPDKDRTALKEGDIIETASKASVNIFAGENTIAVNESTKIKIDLLTEDTINISLLSGEIFSVINDENAFGKFMIDDWSFSSTKGVISADKRTGSFNVRIFEGDVKGTKADKTISGTTGDLLSFVDDKGDVVNLAVNSLNEFNLNKALNASADHELCFTESDINSVIEERKAAKGQVEGVVVDEKGNIISDESATEAPAQEEESTTVTDKASEASTEKEGNTSTTAKKDGITTTTKKGSTTTTKKGSTTTTKKGSTTTTKKSNTTTKKNNTTTTKKTSDNSMYCTIEIRCDSILQSYNGVPNIQKLKPGKEGYVPSNGVILARTTIKFTDGETVFDVLKRACSTFNIQIEYSYTPMYGSYYIEGINHLYEFDCGDQSGWLYEVDGWFPNYGCSSYKLKDGESIVWRYSCNGLGADVGSEWMG